jgi:branched-subunit amino acid transport protein AzlD
MSQTPYGVNRENIHEFIRSEVLIVVHIEIMIFWDMMPCRVFPYLMFSFNDPKSIISMLNYLTLKFSSV